MPLKKKRSMLGMGIIEKLVSLPYTSLFTLWVALAIVFSIAYFGLSLVAPEHAPTITLTNSPVHTFSNSLYYSIITATSTGYGDIVPQGLSKLLASLQSMSALLIFAIFVTKLVSNRQEIALQQVHRLTFKDDYHNLREDLYIIRKDIDRIIADVQNHTALSSEQWTNLVIAYQQTQSALQEIPTFYSEDTLLYTIDKRREEVLQEAVHRTLHRINTLLDILSKNSIDWMSHEKCMQELTEIVDIMDDIGPTWRNQSPYTHSEAFEDIIHMNTLIRNRLKEDLLASK